MAVKRYNATSGSWEVYAGGYSTDSIVAASFDGGTFYGTASLSNLIASGTASVDGNVFSNGNVVPISDDTTNIIRIKRGVTGAVAVTGTNGSSTAFTITYGGTNFATAPNVAITMRNTDANLATNYCGPYTTAAPGVSTAACRGMRIYGNTTTGISFEWIATNA